MHHFRSHPHRSSAHRRSRSAQPRIESLESRTLLDHGARPALFAPLFAYLETRPWLTRPSGLDEAPVAVPKVRKPPQPIVLPLTLVQPPAADGTTTVAGTTTPRAKLKLDVGADGSIEQVVKADKKGRFQFTFHVGYGTTLVEVIGPKSGRRARVGFAPIPGGLSAASGQLPSRAATLAPVDSGGGAEAARST
jgi:hypothetical protein